MFCLTVDGERGRRLRLAHHVLCHAGVGADISRGQATDLQGVVLANLIPGLKQVFVYRETQTHSMQHASADTDKSEPWIRQRPGEGEGGGEVLCDERGPGDESYLALGRSPSSFLQRTVGTGSPRASHLNSTLWSTNTTWLPGRRTKLGRSA